MKKIATLNFGKATSLNTRRARMLAYLARTRPAFAQALEKSHELGAAANGVLAGPKLHIAK